MSKIQAELIKATDYTWDDAVARPKNIEGVCRATTSLEDPDYEGLSQAARDHIDAVITALEESTAVPEFPDFEEPKAEEKPKRSRRRAPPKPEPAPEQEPAGDDKEADAGEAAGEEKAAPKRRTRSKKEPKEPKEPKKDENGLVRGERMNKFRLLVLENIDLPKKELVELADKNGYGVTASTAAMVQYNIVNALRVMKAEGFYDHWAELAKRNK